MDWQIRSFRNTIINFCNLSSLPVEVKRLVFKEIMQMLEEESDKVVNAQISEKNRIEAEQQNNAAEETHTENELSEVSEDDTAQKESESDPGESAGEN